MNEDERAFAQWQQHQHQQALPQLPMAAEPANAVPALPEPAVIVADATSNVLPAVASVVTLEKAQKLVPIGKPVLLIREVSQKQLMEIVNSSQRVLEKSTSWEHLIDAVTWILFVLAALVLVGLAVSFLWRRRSVVRESPPARLMPLRSRRQ